MPFIVSGIFLAFVMYTKPTTFCNSVALEKGVLVAASGIPTDCKILLPASEVEDVFGVNSFGEEKETISW